MLACDAKQLDNNKRVNELCDQEKIRVNIAINDDVFGVKSLSS
jgi:hypothetical protein